jgi:hypothetical protein
MFINTGTVCEGHKILMGQSHNKLLQLYDQAPVQTKQAYRSFFVSTQSAKSQEQFYILDL